MKIHGFNKTTLLDYPKHLAATIFLGSCNYRCPFCHNASLVLHPDSEPTIPEEEVLATLEQRKNILEGVCITGGEPTLYEELPSFIRRIKSLGLKVKLDTNGTNYSMLKYLIDEQLIDYIAMDIKNSKEHYNISSGVNNSKLEDICSSVDLLLSRKDHYEFRTTMVKDHIHEEDLISIGKWIEHAYAYYLQAFKDSNTLITNGLHGYTLDEMKCFVTLLEPYIKNVSIRGID